MESRPAAQDLGGIQRLEPIAGNVRVRITAAEQIGNEVIVTFHKGTMFYPVSANIENLAAAGEPDLDLVRFLVRAHMRDSTLQALVDREMSV